MHSHKEWELTTRHDTMKRVLSRSVFGGSSWSRDEKRYGIRGRVIVTELVPTPTKSRSEAPARREVNWNYVRHNLHFHILLFIDPQTAEDGSARRLTPAERDELQARIYGRWERALKKSGLDAE